MAKRLTGQDLEDLHGLSVCRDERGMRDIAKIAAAEIRELWEIGLENTRLRKLIMAENAKLREALEKYGRHRSAGCGMRKDGPSVCVCGLGDALKENDDG